MLCEGLALYACPIPVFLHRFILQEAQVRGEASRSTSLREISI